MLQHHTYMDNFFYTYEMLLFQKGGSRPHVVSTNGNVQCGIPPILAFLVEIASLYFSMLRSIK